MVSSMTKARWKSCRLLLALLFPVHQLHAQANKPSQYDVQAVYLFDFAKFIHWPAPSSDAPLQICIAGQDSFRESLSKIVAGEHIDTRTITVRRVDHPEDATGCSILFLDASANDRADSILSSVAGKPTLTVSDVPGFLDRGGMIQFLLIANRVRFAVSLPPATRSGLSLSSELLKVAVSVNGTATGGGGR
jgi:hypothetical protein